MTRTTHPRKARLDWLSSIRGRLKESTIRGYETITEDFIEYLESNGIEATKEIDGYVIQQWKIKRKDEDNVQPITLHNNAKHLRVFIKWCEASELVEDGLSEKIQIPDVSDEQSRSERKVSPEQMESILHYLSIYEYASRLHAVSKVLWHTGCRASAVVALDLDDFDPQMGILKIRNRKETGTPLKNGIKSERNVTMNEGVMEVLNAYVEGRRYEVTDEYGRDPLFTTKYGRMTRQRAYKNFVAISRPCVYDNTCPHDRDIDQCDAALNKKQSYECPSSESLHPIRRGSITHHLNQDWPKEKVSERCDVSVAVLEKHYDARTYEDKRQGRSEYLDNL
jgi:site-specific recombinase XerD